MSLPESSRRTFGHYDVESTLGRGAMGMVYLARDRRIGRMVALKTVQIGDSFDDDSTSTEFYKRLQREAELSGSLQHPNVVTLYEAGYEDDRVTYLATEYIEGESLKDFLKKTKPVPVDLAISIAADILRGLAFAHSRGIVHRDIKPANILLTKDRQAKIADFGIARPQDSSLTHAGALLGTPNYMSPEQVKAAPVSPRSDLFSVGVVLYEMLSGTKPFAAGDLSGILQKVLHHEPEALDRLNPEIPAAAANVVRRLMQKDPGKRYPSAEAALADLTGTGLRADDNATVASADDDHSATMRPSEWSASTLHGARPETLLHRAVPPALAWLLLIAMATGGVGFAMFALAELEKPPGAVLTSKQISDAKAKKKALDDARTLFDQRRYDESIRAYDNYLAVYPHSAAAREGRSEAIREKAEAKAGKAAVSPSRTQKKAAVKPAEPEEKPPAPSFRERLRRIFRRG